MDARLNGFCTDFPTQEKEMELQIPYFLTPEWQRKERRKAEERAARKTAAKAAERRKLREKEAARKESLKGTFALISVFAFVVFAVNIVELLA